MIRRIILVLGLVLGVAATALADRMDDQEAEIRDILRLVERGVSDDVVIKHVEARGFVFDLTADDILELRDRGISENVIEAMLDTGVDTEMSTRHSENVYAPDDDPDYYFSLSAGYFSPWYHYPFAWGFYYDPFPVWYSSYYYPFSYCSSWGWYGSSNYWYPSCWTGYRWCDPYYWNDAHHGSYVNAPRNAQRWQAGRGMPARQAGATTSGTRVAQPADRMRSGAPARRVDSQSRPAETVNHPSRGGSRYESRFDRARVRMPDRSRDARAVERDWRASPGQRFAAPRQRSAEPVQGRSSSYMRSGARFQAPRSDASRSASSPWSYRAPGGGRGNAAFSAPRSGGFRAAPSAGARMAPRSR